MSRDENVRCSDEGGYVLRRNSLCLYVGFSGTERRISPVSDRMMLFPDRIKTVFRIFLLNLPGFHAVVRLWKQSFERN